MLNRAIRKSKKVTLSVISLSRWSEYITFVIPLSLLGYLFSGPRLGINPDLRLPVVVIANFLAMSFAFMINDVEDADDDAAGSQSEPIRNPVAAKRISKTFAYFITMTTLAGSVICYLYLGTVSALAGISILLISLAYSTPPLRLKAWPVVDIISHALMLGGLLLLSSYAVYSSDYKLIILPFTGIVLISAYGQLYNQIRDFAADKKAGLKNTAILVGKSNAMRLGYVLAAAGFGCMGLSVLQGLFPLWLILPALLALAAGKYFVTDTDARGTKVVDITGAQQKRINFVINCVVFIWFAYEILMQLG